MYCHHTGTQIVKIGTCKIITCQCKLITPFPFCRFDHTVVVLSEYAGLGINGTNIKLIPESLSASSPYADPSATLSSLPSPPPLKSNNPTPASGDGDGQADQWKIIVGVVVGVGGALILASAAAGMMLLSYACMYLNLMNHNAYDHNVLDE